MELAVILKLLLDEIFSSFDGLWMEMSQVGIKALPLVSLSGRNIVFILELFGALLTQIGKKYRLHSLILKSTSTPKNLHSSTSK